MGGLGKKFEKEPRSNDILEEFREDRMLLAVDDAVVYVSKMGDENFFTQAKALYVLPRLFENVLPRIFSEGSEEFKTRIEGKFVADLLAGCVNKIEDRDRDPKLIVRYKPVLLALFRYAIKNSGRPFLKERAEAIKKEYLTLLEEAKRKLQK